MSKPRKKKRTPKRVLALPDLEQSKTAVLNSLTSRSGQRTYDRAITDFVDWYCSEPRLAYTVYSQEPIKPGPEYLREDARCLSEYPRNASMPRSLAKNRFGITHATSGV